MKIQHRFCMAFILTSLVSLFSLDTSSFAQSPQIVKITAKKFSYSPAEIVIKKGVPVVVQVTSLDGTHGFSVPDWNIRTDIQSGKTAEVKFTPTTAGDVSFHCDVFCGSGHEDMSGTFKVVN